MNSSSSIVFFLTAVLALLAHVQLTAAKRGCASFGHSCYGGMGKRAQDLDPMGNTNEEVLQAGQDEENPAYVFTGPRSPYHQQRLNSYNDNMSKILRQWIQNYRRAQEMQDNNV